MRRLLLPLPAACAALLVLLSPRAPHAAAGGRPNVLFVLTDDMRASDLEYMPHVRELLVEGGASFEAAFVNVSLCCPSRATILTGRYSHNTGVFTNGGQHGGFGRAYRTHLENATVATAMHDAGYRTGYFGKYLNNYPTGAPYGYVPPGWDVWRVPSYGDPASGYGYTIVEPYAGTSYLFPTYYDRQPQNYITDVLVAKTHDFIAEAAAAGTPFFAVLATYAPHLPAVPAPRHARLFPSLGVPRGGAVGEEDVSDKPRFVARLRPIGRRYYKKMDTIERHRAQSLQAVDEGVAALVDELAELGQLDRTYIFFSSDNGYHLGEHRLGWGKQTAYEEDIRVPLFVRGPGVAAGARVSALAGNVDFAPTFADIAGGALADDPDGRSLLPWLHGTGDADAWRHAFLVDFWMTAAEREGDRGSRTPPVHGVRTVRHLYVEYKSGERELYDLLEDPKELDNRAADADPALLQALSERLAALHGCVGQQCRDAEAAPLP